MRTGEDQYFHRGCRILLNSGEKRRKCDIREDSGWIFYQWRSIDLSDYRHSGEKSSPFWVDSQEGGIKGGAGGGSSGVRGGYLAF